MKIWAMGLLAALVLLGVQAQTASAHIAGPCEDFDGDGMASGMEYAHHHVMPMAMEMMLGMDGHNPGMHMGFSACLP